MPRVEVERMYHSSSANHIADDSGLWEVVIYDGGLSKKDSSRSVHKQNLSHKEALELCSELDHKLNNRSQD